MKKLIMVFAAIAMAAIGFVACPQPASNSISRVKDATNYYGGDIYTTVEYDKSACFEVKLAKKTTALDKANITFAVSDGSDEFPVTGIAVVNDSVSAAATSFKITANTVKPGNQTQGDSPKTVDLTKNFKLIVKVAGAAYGEGGKDVTIASGSIFKARSAKVTCDNIAWSTTYEAGNVPAKVATIKLTGCTTKSIPAESFNIVKDVTEGVKVVVGNNPPTDLPEGITVTLIGTDATNDSAGTKIEAGKDTFKVEIKGDTTIKEQAEGVIVFVLPGNMIDGDELTVVTSVKLKVTAPAHAPAQS
jgi:hypothetical protein